MKQAILTSRERVADAALEEHALPHQGRVEVGRSHIADIRLNHSSVSRKHAFIACQGGTYVLSDLGSSNGTLVNGISICRQALRDGDAVQFGDLTFVFHVVEAEIALPPESPGSEIIRSEKEGEESFDSSATATGEAPEIERRFHAESVYAWRFLQHLADTAASGVDAALKGVLEDLAGVEGVRQGAVSITIPVEGRITVDSANQRAEWLREYKLYPESEVVESRWIEHSGDSDSATYGLQLAPIFNQSVSSGALYLEADESSRENVLVASRAAAEALRLFLELLHASPRTAPRQNALIGGAHEHHGIVGRSAELQEALATARKAAGSDSTVLIRGKSGTGKELVARLIVEESARRIKHFSTVHCSAIEPTLMGSTLFGHEKGAFTGAAGKKKGLFEEADGGTLFLDEIGELNADMQVKLLRVLQEGELMRVGGTETIRTDVRILAATNRDLEAAVREDAFRQDLYYRLNVVSVRLPPLREHSGDIPDLVRSFIAEFRRKMATCVESIDNEALQALKRYSWPGNVRELRNVIERAMVLGENNQIMLEDLPPELLAEPREEQTKDNTADHSKVSAKSLQDFEKRHIEEALCACDGNRKLAAQRLGIARSTLYEKIQKLGIS